MLSVGIHIEAVAINVVSLSHKNNKLVLEDCFSIPLTSNSDEAAPAAGPGAGFKTGSREVQKSGGSTVFCTSSKPVTLFCLHFSFS